MRFLFYAPLLAVAPGMAVSGKNPPHFHDLAIW